MGSFWYHSGVIWGHLGSFGVILGRKKGRKIFQYRAEPPGPGPGRMALVAPGDLWAHAGLAVGRHGRTVHTHQRHRAPANSPAQFFARCCHPTCAPCTLTVGSGSGRGQHACKGHPILGHVDIYSTSHRRRGRTTHARAKPFVWGRGPVVGKGPPPGGPQLPGGNLLVYPPDPSSRAGKLLHNRANSELRSLLVGPPTTTTAKT